MKSESLPLLLNVGFNNFIVANQVIALVDYSSTVAKNLVKTAREDKGPRAVINLCRGRKAYTLLILAGDRYVISTIPRKQLARRLGAFSEEVPETKPNRKSKKEEETLPSN